MEAWIIAVFAGFGFIGLLALAGFAFWYFCVREEPVRLEDDPEAPLVAHLQKHVRVQKRPSRAALSDLRSSQYTLVKALLEIGSRPERIYSLVRLNGSPELAMALTPRSPYAAFPYHTENQQRLLRELLSSLKHPFVAPILDIDFIPERDVLVTVRRWCPKGSLKDWLHKTGPAAPYDKKYASVAKMPLERIALFGRQILEALVFLKERGFPYGHLHTGNVIIDEGACRISDYENAFLNLEPDRVMAAVRQYPAGVADPDAIAFGLLIFELAFGYELDPTLALPRVREIDLFPNKTPAPIKNILESIFSGEAKLPALLQNPFFANVPLRDEHRFEIAVANKEPPQLEPKAKDMLRTVVASYCLTDIAAYDRAKSAPPPSVRRSIDGKKKKKKRAADGTSASSYGSSPSVAASPRSPPPQPPPRSTPSPSPLSSSVKSASSPPPPTPPASAGPKPPPPPKAPAASASAAAPPPKPDAGRGALLSSIQSFSSAKLKKTVTVDKSKPMLRAK